MPDDFTKVASLSEVSEGQMVAVRASDGAEVLLANVGGEIYAISDICSHAEAWLDTGWLHGASLEVECPLHEGRFDLRTGEATRDPATDPIRSYNVRVEGSDILLGPAKN